ncbi:MAG: preprotein translocase subunit Sec61beta [Candidatus Hodarchaeota archaeon]
MSKKPGRRQKRRSREGPMPFAGAGLIRFFQEESWGVKVGPYSVIIVTLLLIVGVIIMLAIVPTPAAPTPEIPDLPWAS